MPNSWQSNPLTALGRSFHAAGVYRVGALPVTWSIESVYAATDGRPHVLLINMSDRTVRKTISVDALLDTRLFRPASS
jgi:hypothetical protein